MAGITLPPVQQQQKGGAESMYDATGQLKIKSLGGGFGTSKCLAIDGSREKPLLTETWYYWRD